MPSWKKMTREERAAWRAYQEDLDRRLPAKIEELKRLGQARKAS